jgi:hypothetical protein
MGADPGTLTRPVPVDPGDESGPWRSWLDGGIRHEIACLRVRYELSLDEFRGLYVSDEQVDRLLAARDPVPAPSAPRIPAFGPRTPFGRLAEEFGLSPTEVGAVFVAFAPELDRKYETLYAYLSDDVTRRSATVDLCRRLAGASSEQMDVGAPLFADGPLEAVRTEAGPAWRSAGVVPRDPVRRFLLGSDPIPVPGPVEPPSVDAHRIAAALGSDGLTCVALAGGPGDEALAAARAIAAQAGRALVEVRADEGIERLRDELLTARLHRAWVFMPLHLADPVAPSASTLVRTAVHAPVLTLFGVPAGGSWRPLFDGTDHEVVVLSPPEASQRESLWSRGLREQGVSASDRDVEAVAGLFSLYPGQIRRAAARAGRMRNGGDADLTSLTACARSECTTALCELADRVALVHEWSDLVFPAPTMRRLREFAGAIRCRDRVFRDWAFLRPTGGTPSLRALFSGASGTGKTMSAAVVARDLGLDLFRIDLSAVVSKYIGETEKNLERIFTAAEGSNAILLFDEADALFGKRSEIRDAHDRYANIEVAYLLQRMETYDGVMILATNLSNHLDEAFGRRIHFDIEFSPPDEEQRERLWRLLIPAAAPTRDDVDHAFLARQFQLTGGEIRNVALAAAFLAAYEDGEIAMHHLVRAMARQRRKQGKLPTASEFKGYFAAVHDEGG